MKPLTPKQAQVLTYIESCLENQYTPSQREMADHFNLSRNAICQLLGYLKSKGYLENDGGHRGLRLSTAYLSRKKAAKGIPILGRVAAGNPILAQEHIEGYIKPEEWLGGSESCFVLKVRGDSMVGVGIMDGDYVLVEPCDEVPQGKIGVVLLDDEATVKEIRSRGNKIALVPANKAYRTRQVRKDNPGLRIIGKVTANFRRLG
ncbi:transcriptional repressor LexA [Planctomycetota bacterium]